jgi:hypothetical protein
MLAARLAIAESSLNRAELKDAVAERPKTKKRRLVAAPALTPLPGYNR